MGIWERVKKIWQISGDTSTYTASTIGKETAVFIMPNRISEILANKKDATIDDMLV